MASRPRSSLPKSRGRKLSDVSIAESAPAVCRSGIFQFAPNQTFSNGCVESRGIFWCKSGSGEFEVNGVRFTIGPNDLYILPWGRRITYRDRKEHTSELQSH